MRNRIKRIMVVVMTLLMIVTGITGTYDSVQAAYESKVENKGDSEYLVNVGQTNHIRMEIISTGTTITNPSIAIKAQSDKAPFAFSNTEIIFNNSTINNIYSGGKVYLEFDVKVKDSGLIGDYKVDITFNYYDDYTQANNTSTLTINLKIDKEKAPIQLTVNDVTLGNNSIGSNTEIYFAIKNEGEINAKSIYLTINLGNGIEERYSAKRIKIGDLTAGNITNITLPISILTTAATGRNTLVANFEYKTPDGDLLTSTYNIYINLTSNANALETPKIIVKDVQMKEGLKPGDNFSVELGLENTGAVDAKNILVAVDDSSIDTSGILRRYYTKGIETDTVGEGEEKKIEIPLSVSKYATGGLKTINLIITFNDAAGIKYTVNNSVYVDVAATVTPIAESPNLVISNVSQSPAKPIAGDKVEVTFILENRGNVDAKELKISTEGLTSATFIPVSSEPYQYFEKLKAGSKVKVTIPLMVSTEIVEGMNSITVKCAYQGNEGATGVSIPIRDVQNDSVTVSKPKIIVSKYSTDVTELRAGSTFNFTFDLYNTNSKVAAKNISVTISQADNIFTVTQGSSSFFIEKIDPGETVTQTLEMKVKSDATTKAYPVEILIEYEYDGAKANPTTGEIGEKKTEKLNLQAIENARPVVDNVNVYSWDGMVTVGNTAYLSFEFYNMGKSQLNNVVATVEGDFAKSDGSMYFIGNVTAGSSSYVEFEVIPNVEGTASGVLKVTYEDSNGDEVEFTKDFTGEVMTPPIIDPGVVDGGSGEVFNPGVPLVKAAILPVWAFIILQIVILAIFIPVTRKIIIGAYRAKLRKKNEE